jgi:hypothetical protein
MSINRLTFAAIVAFAGALPAFPQAFSSGSTGSDGALNFNTPGVVVFDPVALGLDPAGDNIFNFTTINIAAGVTVQLTASKLREKSVVWLASGAVTIAGILNLSGANGYEAGSSSVLRVPAQPGPGGFPGGVGQSDSSPAQAGAGPGGGNCCGNASYATGIKAYGNSLLVPLRGGSGGSGDNVLNGGGGGAGGGAIQIVSSTSITVTGSILANGGAPIGSNGAIYGAESGYFGSGGAIHLEAPVISGTGLIEALGYGQLDNPARSDVGDGWIRVDSTTNSFTGKFLPAAIDGPLFNVPLPTAVPTVAITSINGTVVPAVPTGSFQAPDVTINNAAAVPIALAATNIPLGTVVSLIVSSETGADQTVAASPLAGTVASSTATANIVWPLGVSRVFIRAIW